MLVNLFSRFINLLKYIENNNYLNVLYIYI